MRAWRRAIYDIACGLEPGCLIRVNDPYLELKGDGWRKVRCAKHAGDPVPAVIETAYEVKSQRPRLPSWKPFTSTKELASVVDIKRRQSNDDSDAA